MMVLDVANRFRTGRGPRRANSCVSARLAPGSGILALAKAGAGGNLVPPVGEVHAGVISVLSCGVEPLDRYRSISAPWPWLTGVAGQPPPTLNSQPSRRASTRRPPVTPTEQRGDPALWALRRVRRWQSEDELRLAKVGRRSVAQKHYIATVTGLRLVAPV
jgi:hypothetical protein